ncbi:hypothetical protein Hanom_Chr05g00440991 [Helianthus anomalus]
MSGITHNYLLFYKLESKSLLYTELDLTKKRPFLNSFNTTTKDNKFTNQNLESNMNLKPT